MATPSQPLALPARMRLNPTGFQNMGVAVLPFPYAADVYAFCKDMQQVLRLDNPLPFPIRQLNNALLSCASTLTHGFEYYDKDPVSGITHYRALAVGTPNAPLHLPAAEQIHRLLKDWANEWTRQYRGKNNGEADTACERLLNGIAERPAAWNWKSIDPLVFINDLHIERGIGYEAIPSLLATLLHNTTCEIGGGHGKQVITWRKVVGVTANRTGLFLVSQPFYAWYVDEDGKTKQGYFAYRLDFHVQTQAGSFTKHSKLQPWVFTHLSCQRYAHESLKQSNYGRDVSVLVGMKTARLPGIDADSTLVRLVFNNGGRDRAGTWKFQLPEYLEAFNARRLEEPRKIKANPLAHGNFHSDPMWKGDEYYLVHAEGYTYGDEDAKKGHGHAVKTGYAFDEHGDIIARVLEHLNGILVADDPMTCDLPAPSGAKKPLAMRDYDYLKGHPKDHYQIAVRALDRVREGKPVHVFVIWRERDTRDAIVRQLHESLQLGGDTLNQDSVSITDIYVNDASLLNPLDTAALTMRDDPKAFDAQMRKQHVVKRDTWRGFLQRAIPQVPGYRLAIIEIGKRMQSGVNPRQSIHAAVRDACALEGINSQMIQPIAPKESDANSALGLEDTPEYRAKDKGRLQNAALDLIFRQTGLMLGMPMDVYRQAGLPLEVAKTMDVIAFCRRQTKVSNGDIHYTLAVRLSANGSVDVLLPGHDNWMPYLAAGPILGRLFSKARNDQLIKGKRVKSQFKLNGQDLATFVANVMTKKTRQPTLFVIEADGWRNSRGEYGALWPQLQNERLHQDKDVLDFAHVRDHVRYTRQYPQVHNVLGVIRVRTGRETPQYIANRPRWTDRTQTRDFTRLSGFYDESVPDLLHYFSVGRLPTTQKSQDTSATRGLYKLDRAISRSGPRFNIYGMDLAFKHQQMVEMVPFFVRPDMQSLEQRLTLCRAIHYLRTSPAWTMGNTTFPYPMHLGDVLIDDQICILGFDE